MIFGKSSQNSLRRISLNSLKPFKDLNFSCSSLGPLPARGTDMFSRLLGLNTWLQWSCGIKGVDFIDNFNIFWGHRQLFKLDGLYLNRLGARVLKDNIYFSLHHPSVMFANPLCLNGTHIPRQIISDHRTSFQLQSHHMAHTFHKDTDKHHAAKATTAHGHPGWALPTELITCRLWHITTVPRLSNQGQLSGTQPEKPGQHFTATRNTRARDTLIRHIIP